MSARSSTLTATQVILLAADDLDRAGRREFSEWDLTVAAWKRDQNRFGLRGFESEHPDHKRVMMEIMGKTKRDNPIRRQFMVRTRENHYGLTDLGRSEAELVASKAECSETTLKSPAKTYTALEPFVTHSAFERWLQDPEEPRSWLAVSSFLGLRTQRANELNDRIRAVHRAVDQAERWAQANGRDRLTHGPLGGGKGAFSIERIRQLTKFVQVLEDRFQRQMSAIRAKGS